MSNNFVNNFINQAKPIIPNIKGNKEIATPVPSDGYMLPSRIFGSPKRALKNLKNDVVTIKKGAQGKANDHELGRLNDLAMKAGSLLLAAYLFSTKPFKTSKAMEFVGFGSFFASMALWPKLFIQAPIKARTGVDIHRKYVDSFGREKMFFQDPQYVPWSLMSQAEIDKMGDKLKISKDTPNRNAVIQDTARKTAVQGNTLWMYTAGFATPLMSALICNFAEPKIDGLILNSNLKSTQKHLENSSLTLLQRIKHGFELRQGQKFIKSLADKPLDSKTISEIAQKFGNDNLSVSQTLESSLQRLAKEARLNSVPMNKNNLGEVISKVAQRAKLPSDVAFELEDVVTKLGTREISSATLSDIADKLAGMAAKGNKFQQKKLTGAFTEALTEVFEAQRVPKTSAVADKLTNLSQVMANLKAKTGIFDRFFAARTKATPGTLLGKQYTGFSQEVIEALGLKPTLFGGKKLLSDDEVIRHIEQFVESDKFDSTIKSLDGRIETFHRDFDTTSVFKKMKETLSQAGEHMRGAGFGEVADKMTGAQPSLTRTLRALGFKEGEEVSRDALAKAFRDVLGNDQKKMSVSGIFERETGIQIGDNMDKLKRSIEDFVSGQPGSSMRAMRTEAEERILGAQSSFYRTIQTFDIFKKIKNGTLRTQLENISVDGQAARLTPEEVNEAIDYAKKFITKGTIVDHSDKARYMNTQSGKRIHDAVMRVLFDDGEFPTEIGSPALKSRMRAYKSEVKSKIVDIMHSVEAPHNQRWMSETVEHMQGITKHNLVGEPIVDSVKNGVQNMKNSNKWLKIFGTAFLALVGITLIAGTQFGKHNKKAEKEGEKTNG
ncbi:hypothetical protein IKQ26_05750 [bacterium]|nr:hypothetical protein [bacterium]